MDKLTPKLTEVQLRQNIDALRNAGTDVAKIQSYVDNYRKSQDGGYILASEIPTERATSLADRALNNPVTRGIQKVFPGEKLGEAIGTSVAGINELRKGNTEGFNQIIETQVSPMQVGADVANIGLNTATIGGAGVAGKFLPRLLKSIGLGASISGTEALSEGASIGEAAKSAAAGGAVGAAIPVAGSGLSAIGRQIEQLPERFINSALGRNKAQILNELKSGKDTLAQYVINNKRPLSANKLLEESSTAVDDLSKKISENLRSAVRETGGGVTIGRDNLIDDVTKTPEADGALLKRADVRAVIERLAPQTKKLLQKPSLSLTEANQLRQLVDKTLGDKAFLGSQLSSDKAVLKSFADALRNEVKEKAPEGTKLLFSELSNEINLRNNLLDKVARGEKNQLFSISDILATLVGSPGGFVGSAATVAVKRLAESTPAKILGAQSAQAISKAISKAAPTLERLTPAQQTVILNLFSEIFSPSISENETEDNQSQ